VPNIAVIGAQWGDEGKGKVVDLLTERFDVVARFQGGPNAGHTVTIGDRSHALHHIPSGVFRPEARIVIGNGTVLDLGKLIEELEGLDAVGVKVDGRLFISDRAHVILPLLTMLDEVAEAALSADSKIGTTLRGVGPTYQAKAARWGVRIADLADPQHLQAMVQRILDGPGGRQLQAAGQPLDSAAEYARQAHDHYRRLEPFVADTSVLLNDWIDDGKRVLFEGAQGTLLDLDHGSYPFVTSSSTMAGGVCAGLGLAPRLVDGVLGVFKAYCTRVGSGPMPTELEDGPEGFGQKLRDRGHEYGTTTGRPRRCGWFDAVAARYATRINRYDGACIMLLDVLDAFDEIHICNRYEIGGRELRGLPASVAQAEKIEPVYETLEGWRSDRRAATSTGWGRSSVPRWCWPASAPSEPRRWCVPVRGLPTGSIFKIIARPNRGGVWASPTAPPLRRAL
jgi:adenylosuccinate synthase